MSLRAFRSLETGEADDPHYSTLSKLAEALGLSVSELVGEKSLVPLSEAPEGEAGPPAQVDRLQVLNDYAESFSSIAEKKRRELEILEEEGQEKPLEVLRLEALAAYLGVKGFVKEAEAMQPQQGESVSESRARRRVLDAVDELFEIARLKVPAAIKRLSSGEPQRENATVTSLYDYQRRHAG
jgi:transcriptional regulator with XRE-family HTH domain